MIRLSDGSRIHENAPDQLGRFDDQKVQYTGARGRWMRIAYRAHRPSNLLNSRSRRGGGFRRGPAKSNPPATRPAGE